MKDKEKEEKQERDKKRRASQNKRQLKDQINSKRMQDLQKWRNELEYEKDIISNQMSKETKTLIDRDI